MSRMSVEGLVVFEKTFCFQKNRSKNLSFPINYSFQHALLQSCSKSLSFHLQAWPLQIPDHYLWILLYVIGCILI
jgi:hypothetical protein